VAGYNPQTLVAQNRNIEAKRLDAFGHGLDSRVVDPSIVPASSEAEEFDFLHVQHVGFCLLVSGIVIQNMIEVINRGQLRLRATG